MAPTCDCGTPPAVVVTDRQPSDGAATAPRRAPHKVLARAVRCACRSGLRVTAGVALWARRLPLLAALCDVAHADVLHLTTGVSPRRFEFFIYDTRQGAAAAHDRRLRRRHRALVLQPAAHARPAARPARGDRQRDGREPRHRHAVLQLLGRAAVHRLRRGRHPAGRHLLVPHRRADGQRDRAGAALRPVRLGGRGPLPQHRPPHRHGRRLGDRPPQDGALHRGLGARDPHGRRRGHAGARLGRRACAYAWQAVKDIVGKVWPYVLAGIAVGAAHPRLRAARTSWPASWAPTPGGACRLAVLLGIPMYSNAAGIIPIVAGAAREGRGAGHRAGLHDGGHRALAARDDHPRARSSSGRSSSPSSASSASASCSSASCSTRSSDEAGWTPPWTR